MTKTQLAKFHKQLQKLSERIQGTASAVEERARQSTGGEAAGNLSNTPIHLGDLGSEVSSQELSATLLENEQYLQLEILAALGRIESGTFGVCANCRQKIAHERLAALPYARHCIACAAMFYPGREVNMNEGRPANWEQGIGLRAEGPPEGALGASREEEQKETDSHAAGTPGGGSAVGGLAGTNIGAGGPEEANLEDAMASGTFDIAIEGEERTEKAGVEEGPTAAYSGHAGGAVGGTPANKRVVGGRQNHRAGH